MAVLCTWYLNDRAQLVPKWGEWWAPGTSSFTESDPVTLEQVRALLSGRLALYPHPVGSSVDSFWGRGGIHSGWGLGIPILATPLHLLGRLCGAPGFPDSVRFLIFYAITAVVLARALHRIAPPKEPTALAAGIGAAGFFMLFPTFVGMLCARFLIYEQTIATGCLWCLILLAGMLALIARCTPSRLVLVCAAAGFASLIRPTLALYGIATAALAFVIARSHKLGWRALLRGVGAYAAMAALYPLSNYLRFGSAFNTGYKNCTSGHEASTWMRWGVPSDLIPLSASLKEQFAILFLLEPTPQDTSSLPASMQPYVTGHRYWQFYTPTFDRIVPIVWAVAVVIVCVRVVRGRLWRRDRVIDREEAKTVVGAWALLTVPVLFVFYARLEGMATRYADDMYPAFAAAGLCVGMAIVDFVRRRASARAPAMQLAITGAVALYMSSAEWQGWPVHLSRPWKRKALDARLADRDARAQQMPPVPDHFVCGEPQSGPDPVYGHLDDWFSDCNFLSGLLFAMPYRPCVSFTVVPRSGNWDAAATEALDGFRAKADFDNLSSCGVTPIPGGNARKLTWCETRPPKFLLDGLRLYAIGTLDKHLNSISDRLKLQRIDGAASCQ
jgi:hypothetical protein